MRAPSAVVESHVAAEHRGTTRIVVIDALRGLALSFMALEHASYYARVSTAAEYYVGRNPTLWKWPFWVTGLITNMAAPTFWLVAGVSIALYEGARRRKGATEGSITRFFLTRAAALILLDVTVIALLWGSAHGILYSYQFDVLSSMGVSLAAFSVLRRLPTGVIAAGSFTLLVGYEALVRTLGPHLMALDSKWLSLFVLYDTQHGVPVRFPILGWCGLMGLGLVLGRSLRRPALDRPRTWLAAGTILLLVWLAIRSMGGYGNFVPYDPATPWRFFLVMSKGPPSLDFMTFNLAITAFVFALFFSRRELLGRFPLSWLVICGQASLFFYVAHHAVYQVVGLVASPLLQLGGILRYALIFLLGFVILVPLTRLYRSLRRRRPESILRYF